MTDNEDIIISVQRPMTEAEIAECEKSVRNKLEPIKTSKKTVTKVKDIISTIGDIQLVKQIPQLDMEVESHFILDVFNMFNNGTHKAHEVPAKMAVILVKGGWVTYNSGHNLVDYTKREFTAGKHWEDWEKEDKVHTRRYTK